ncbi:hypothetical protein HK102_007794 [Quaeritorhiza haematococci]|nr:hypothetical protein HK102_007794 [Quaeritorhiza haematococci]
MVLETRKPDRQGQRTDIDHQVRVLEQERERTKQLAATAGSDVPTGDVISGLQQHQQEEQYQQEPEGMWNENPADGSISAEESQAVETATGGVEAEEESATQLIQRILDRVFDVSNEYQTVLNSIENDDEGNNPFKTSRERRYYPSVPDTTLLSFPTNLMSTEVIQNYESKTLDSLESPHLLSDLPTYNPRTGSSGWMAASATGDDDALAEQNKELLSRVASCRSKIQSLKVGGLRVNMGGGSDSG